MHVLLEVGLSTALQQNRVLWLLCDVLLASINLAFGACISTSKGLAPPLYTSHCAAVIRQKM
jgi:hypothetical protein